MWKVPHLGEGSVCLPALWQSDRMALTGSCGVRPVPADVSLTQASFNTHTGFQIALCIQEAARLAVTFGHIVCLGMFIEARIGFSKSVMEFEL